MVHVREAWEITYTPIQGIPLHSALQLGSASRDPQNKEYQGWGMFSKPIPSLRKGYSQVFYQKKKTSTKQAEWPLFLNEVKIIYVHLLTYESH